MNSESFLLVVRLGFSLSLVFGLMWVAARVLRAPGGGLYKYETEGTYTYSINDAVASNCSKVPASA